MTDSLAGKLLIASPAMGDWFRRSVVLVVEHTSDGAFGLVLNRPSETTLGEVAVELADTFGGEELIHVGGPVSPGSVTALAEHPDPDLSTKLIVGTVGMVDLDEPPADLGRARVYAGYAGWAPDQLDGEVEQEAWVVEEARAGDPFGDGDLWADSLARKGGEYALLARMPEDPSVN